jgi:hypothetical protein
LSLRDSLKLKCSTALSDKLREILCVDILLERALWN